MLCPEGGDFHASGIVRPLFSGQDTLDLAELAANLSHHLLGGAADSVHGESAEEVAIIAPMNTPTRTLGFIRLT